MSSAPPEGTLAKRSVSKLIKRQDYDPNPNIVTSIPGCHDNWIQFLTNWYQFVYLYSFLMVPYSLATFVTGLLAVNHLYVN